MMYRIRLTKEFICICKSTFLIGLPQERGYAPSAVLPASAVFQCYGLESTPCLHYNKNLTVSSIFPDIKTGNRGMSLLCIQRQNTIIRLQQPHPQTQIPDMLFQYFARKMIQSSTWTPRRIRLNSITAISFSSANKYDAGSDPRDTNSFPARRPARSALSARLLLPAPAHKRWQSFR